MNQFIQSVLIPGLAHGAILALVAIGFTVLYATTDVINFGHGQLVMVLPTAVLVAVRAGVPVPIAYLVGIVVLIAVALVIERLAVRPFMHAHQDLTWIISTLGASVVLTELLAYPFDAESQNFPYGLSRRGFPFLGYRVSWAEIAAVAAAIIVAVLLVLFSGATDVGLRLRALGEGLRGAQAVGVSRARAARIAMALSAVIAGVPGALVASSQLVPPTGGSAYSFGG